jgi:hypothetical protein
MKKTVLILGILLMLNAGAFSVVSLTETNMIMSNEEGATVTGATSGTATVIGHAYSKDGNACSTGTKIREIHSGDHWCEDLRLYYDSSFCRFEYQLHDLKGETQVRLHLIDWALFLFLPSYESDERTFTISPGETIELEPFYVDQRIGRDAKPSTTHLLNGFLLRFLSNHLILNALLDL